MKQAILFLMLFTSGSLLAQHQHGEKKDSVPVMHHQGMKMDTVPKGNHHPMKMDTVSRGHNPAMEMPGTMNHDHFMSHAYSLNLPMNRNGSGTAWLPDASPMYMYMTGKKTMWMFHGSAFLRYTNTGVFKNTDRSSSKFDAPNWFMAMLNRRVGKRGLFTAKAMVSADRLTEGGGGYPLLFQSGESWRGNPLVDRQHPHDLFSELSIGYSHAVSRDLDVFGYAGYPGEPALSAPAFMHRISAMNNPDAPLGHHWQDATHITFGVATLGVRYRQFKLESSVFTGREPGEDRYNFDKPRLNSYSYRLSYNPSRNWAFQFSQGFIESPEALHPEEDVTRTTASALYSKQLTHSAQLDAALIWGLNDSGEDHQEHSVLLESNLQFAKSAVYQRYEFIQKSAGELGLETELGHQAFNIHVLTTGYNHRILRLGVIELVGGGQLTYNLPAKQLKPFYGSFPVGAQIYLQLRPGRSGM